MEADKLLFSELIENLNVRNVCIENEQDFETLALCDAQIPEKFCTFVMDKKYIKSISPNAVMVLTTEEIAKQVITKDRGIAIIKNPRNFFFELHNYLLTVDGYRRKMFATRISETAQISELAYISQYNVIIGEHVIIEPFVTIYPNVEIKDHTVVRSGCRIGGEGYEFKRTETGIMAVKHGGGVIIGEHVEIQNNSCIDKAVYPWDNTVLGNHVKTDNLVHVAHAVKVGDNTMLVAQMGIGGRTVIGKNTWIGFGATIRNGITIGNNARANMGAVVTKSISDNEAVSGNFAIDHKLFIEQMKEKVIKEKS